MTEKYNWKTVPRGTVVKEPASSWEYETGEWRTYRPDLDPNKCIQCLFCWAFCPDSAILVDEKGKVVGIDYDHCKGCGICSKECPDVKGRGKAIVMKTEDEGQSLPAYGGKL